MGLGEKLGISKLKRGEPTPEELTDFQLDYLKKMAQRGYFGGKPQSPAEVRPAVSATKLSVHRPVNPAHWWADPSHVYKRRSVEANVKGWCGWINLQKTLERIGGRRGDVYKRVFIATFEVGGRIREALRLRKENFEVLRDKKAVVVRGMPVEKVKKKTTDSAPVRDEFAFYFDPLTPLLVEILQDSKGGLLFPDVKYHAVYMSFSQVGIFPHWLRSMRACQLRAEQHMKTDDMMTFFSWRQPETARLYGRLGAMDLLEVQKPIDYSVQDERIAEAKRLGIL